MGAMKKAMKSQVAKGKRAKSSVFRGTKAKTSGGLTKDMLMKNKKGKVVSKKASAAAWPERLRRCRRQVRTGPGAVCQGQVSLPGLRWGRPDLPCYSWLFTEAWPGSTEALRWQQHCT